MSGLTKLNNKVFTIINQIPTSATVATKIAWKKYRFTNCGKRDGLYDKSSGTMSYKANTWTEYRSSINLRHGLRAIML